MKCKLFFTIVILTVTHQSFSMTPDEQLNLNNQLFVATLENNNAEVASLLQAGATTNDKDNLGVTYLHWAARYGQSTTVQLLLSYGADINAKDIYGNTPLHDVASAGQTATVKLLLAHGADIYAKANFGLTPLHSAAFKGHPATAELLLAHGADVNAKDTINGSTPLHWAASAGQTATVELLKVYQTLYEQDRKLTPKQLLRVAIEHGYSSLVKWLLQRVTADASDLQLAKEKWQTAEQKQSYEAIGRMLITHLSLAPGKALSISGRISKAGIVGQYGLPEPIAQEIAQYQ